MVPPLHDEGLHKEVVASLSPCVVGQVEDALCVEGSHVVNQGPGAGAVIGHRGSDVSGEHVVLCVVHGHVMEIVCSRGDSHHPPNSVLCQEVQPVVFLLEQTAMRHRMQRQHETSMEPVHSEDKKGCTQQMALKEEEQNQSGHHCNNHVHQQFQSHVIPRVLHNAQEVRLDEGRHREGALITNCSVDVCVDRNPSPVLLHGLLLVGESRGVSSLLPLGHCLRLLPRDNCRLLRNPFGRNVGH
mmetsp:Transcript_20822/g.41528  ORF Transcript_20822/g.41528 Transcript_20822/m.41528 type:complete len:242 (-) Transcript_20822:112-837(-)